MGCDETQTRARTRRRVLLLAIGNLAIVTWFCLLGGAGTVRELLAIAGRPFGVVSPNDTQEVLAVLAIVPFILPIGWLGVVTLLARPGTLMFWVWCIPNALLWAGLVDFLLRLIRLGDFRAARDQSIFSWPRRRHPRGLGRSFSMPEDGE